MTTTNYTKKVTLDRITKDYLVEINGECIGYAASESEGWSKANRFILDQLTRTPNAIAEAEEVTESTPASPNAQAAAITRESVKAAAELAYEIAPEWSGAVSKALEELNKGRWLFTSAAVVIRSSTRNTQYRLVRGQPCQCEAARRGLRCWHKAAAGLLRRAARVA